MSELDQLQSLLREGKPSDMTHIAITLHPILYLPAEPHNPCQLAVYVSRMRLKGQNRQVSVCFGTADQKQHFGQRSRVKVCLICGRDEMVAENSIVGLPLASHGFRNFWRSWCVHRLIFSKLRADLDWLARRQRADPKPCTLICHRCRLIRARFTPERGNAHRHSNGQHIAEGCHPYKLWRKQYCPQPGAAVLLANMRPPPIIQGRIQLVLLISQ